MDLNLLRADNWAQVLHLTLQCRLPHSRHNTHLSSHHPTRAHRSMCLRCVDPLSWILLVRKGQYCARDLERDNPKAQDEWDQSHRRNQETPNVVLVGQWTAVPSRVVWQHTDCSKLGDQALFLEGRGGLGHGNQSACQLS